MASPEDCRELILRAHGRRAGIVAGGATDAYRVFHGAADGLEGVFIDRLGPAAALIMHQGRHPPTLDGRGLAWAVFEALRPMGVRGVYLKPFVPDRSRLGGEPDPVLTDPVPAAGDRLPEALQVREEGIVYEARPYDGFSTGLFLDQRENRRLLAGLPVRGAVLNTFSYTCSFSVALARAGRATTSVDVSARYLDWGRRNFRLNGLDDSAHRFWRMDTFEFFAYAQRKGLRYGLVILDPPTFSAGSKRRGVRPFSAARDYARLVRSAAGLLEPGGRLFVSTNAQELCAGRRLEEEAVRGLGRTPKSVETLPAPIDFPGDLDRSRCLLIEP